MVLPLHIRFAHALDAASRSPFIDGPGADRPWRRLVSFVLLAALLMFAMAVVIGLAASAIPSLSDRLSATGRLPDTPMRLVEEGVQSLVSGAMLGALAFSILAAAALTYRRPLTDFLWPGRRFSAGQMGVGFLATACMSVVLIPVHLAMGSEWAPPILDPHYLDRTRLIYVVAMTASLLVAAAAEEVVCRGVLLRLTGYLTRRPILLCLINGLLFSAIHLDPDPIAFIARTISGMVWTWAALRLGGLEFAIGSHLANNLMICLFWAPLSEIWVERESHWIDLGPEILTAIVIVAIVERLAGRDDGLPAGLPARPAA